MNPSKSPLLTAEKIDKDLISFLSGMGNIFQVFDKQDSGCISYGVRTAERNWFVKYAESTEAVGYMKNAQAFHKAVSHPNIPKLLNAFHTDRGFALVYEWADGQVLGTPDFPGKEGRNHPDSPHSRFRQLPAAKIVKTLTTVYDIHQYLESKGFVAVDFYDGCMIYDFGVDTLHLCDFDHYAKGPFQLQTDRLFGSSRFMAPEEFVKHSRIDQVTNVFTMGAAAFVFLADGSRAREDWRGSEAAYRVASKAASHERGERYDSVRTFYSEWLKAIN